MPNDAARAEYWKGFILEKCEYPAPHLLRDQLKHSELTDFCQCGCNSFGLRVDAAHAKPLLSPRASMMPGSHAAVYTADFNLGEEKTLEIIIFADDRGHLTGVDVDCCGNNYRVPEEVIVEEPPFNTWAAKDLIRER